MPDRWRMDEGSRTLLIDFRQDPLAICAPVHPWMLAATLRLFGDTPTTAIPATILEIAIQTAALLLLLRISAILFATWIPGAIAAVVMMFVTEPLPQWENALAWLAMEAVFLGLLTGARSLWVGVGMGVAWLVSPALSLTCIAILSILRGWRQAVWCTGIAAVVIAPWMARNTLVFRTPTFVRDNFGLELYLSKNDIAGPRQQDTPELYLLLHPSQNADAVAELRQSGETTYFEHLQARAVDWIRTHPRRFLQLTATRIGLWWGSSWLLVTVTLSGCLGVWMLHGRPIGRAAAAAMLIYPLPYYAVHYDPRYAWPVVWLVAMFGGYVCWRASILVRAKLGGGPRFRHWGG